jgi:hypothetical protein
VSLASGAATIPAIAPTCFNGFERRSRAFSRGHIALLITIEAGGLCPVIYSASILGSGRQLPKAIDSSGLGEGERRFCVRRFHRTPSNRPLDAEMNRRGEGDRACAGRSAPPIR